MLVTDRAELAGTRRTRDGYLVAEARAGRTGIQVYSGHELERPDLPLVRVYRPEDEVFDAAAMATAANRPITNNHPTEHVNAATWRDVAVGMTGGEVVRDGSFLRVPLILMDKGAIEDFEAGKRELSFGYDCQLEWTAGKTADGEEYHAVQRGIRINHLAVVDRGRAGPECRIGDADRAAQPPPPPTTTNGERAVPDNAMPRAVLLDGLTVQTNDAGAEVIARWQRQMSDAAAAAETQRADLARQITARDGQIAALRDEATRAQQAHEGTLAATAAAHQGALDALRGELDALRAQTSDAALDARVAARSALVSQARRVLGDSFDATGQTDVAIRRAVVTKASPHLRLPDDASEVYITAAFDTVMASPAMAAAAPKPDPLRAGFIAGAGSVAPQDAAPQRTPWQDNVSYLENAWRTGGQPVKGA